MRRIFLVSSVLVPLFICSLALIWPQVLWAFVVVLPLVITGYRDLMQTKQAVRRNFPLVGNFRYLFEAIRPEINQYFVESNTDGVPFNRDTRSLVYQRSKGETDTVPFGTRMNVYEIGYEWVNHSLAPLHVDPASLRVKVGGPACDKPYDLSIFNISAMSYGSLSKNAILALNQGARMGGFLHDTGEGGISPYHLQPGGDLTWEIGTGYFSARTLDGKFSPERFSENAAAPQIKMIEIKLSQGAKPGHGGILPAAKVTKEIAQIRGVRMGEDVNSPPAHTAFNTPIGLLEFVEQLRKLSKGKPVGFKLCLGKSREFLAICKAMRQTGITPDFITVDGGEGGTGAAPLEFSNSVGMPLREGLIFVHNALVGFNLRKQIRILSGGKLVTGFDIISHLSIGADACNSARAMMMALGCIQALRCNTNRCPTGVATQDPALVEGLVVSQKAQRVANYHRDTVHSVAELLGAMGLPRSSDLRPWHVMKRTGLAVAQNYSELYEFIEEGSLLGDHVPTRFKRGLLAADAKSFLPNSGIS